ncbi:TPA: ImmA/IrrE family metallo-endopeptidase [Streptococcus suis]
MGNIYYYDGRESGIDGFYDYNHDIICINTYLDDIDKKKVLYHELGHVGQHLENYERMREKFELQADRNMIHHLVKEELASMDDVKEFNYVRFMEKYELTSLADEIMVKEEFFNLID